MYKNKQKANLCHFNYKKQKYLFRKNKKRSIWSRNPPNFQVTNYGVLFLNWNKNTWFNLCYCNWCGFLYLITGGLTTQQFTKLVSSNLTKKKMKTFSVEVWFILFLMYLVLYLLIYLFLVKLIHLRLLIYAIFLQHFWYLLDY